MSYIHEPASAILASALYDVSEKEKRAVATGSIGTGCRAIDEEALDGGLRYGKGGICCISGGRGLGKTALSLHLLISHLLIHPDSPAFVLDTTGAFSIPRLYTILLSRLRAHKTAATFRHFGGHVYKRHTPRADADDGQDDATRAEQILETVKYIRVLDFIGIVEALNEIGHELEEAKREKGLTSQKTTPGLHSAGPREEIQDSQGEEDEEMLDAPIAAGLDADAGNNQNYPAEPLSKSQRRQGPTAGMIIIDSITHAVSPLMRSNHIQGHALLTSALRQLSHLTTAHNLCTILINNAVTPQPGSTHPSPDPPSVFASNTSRPALGKTFPYFVDLHLFVSRLPKERKDADAVYGRVKEEEWPESRGGLDMGWVNVVEVLADRYEGRVGRWSACVVGRDGVGLEGA